jgi:hypothetical protein
LASNLYTGIDAYRTLGATGAFGPDTGINPSAPNPKGLNVIQRTMTHCCTIPAGAIYHLKYKPPPPEVMDRLVQRSDDTEEKVRAGTAPDVDARCCRTRSCCHVHGRDIFLCALLSSMFTEHWMLSEAEPQASSSPKSVCVFYGTWRVLLPTGTHK